MKRFVKAIFMLIAAICCFGSSMAQPAAESIIGKWKSVMPFHNSVMEVILSAKDSSYTEIVRSSENNKVLSVYKAIFHILNDTTIKVSRGPSDRYQNMVFTNINEMRFYQYSKKLKEDIPLCYVFTFKRLE